MTTLISLAARDFIAVGCDSLATVSTLLVSPGDIHEAFFDSKGQPKTDQDGKPILKEARQIWEIASDLPINQLPSVTKLYDLKPMCACVLFAGTSLIGEITVRNLVETFKADGRFLALTKTGTVEQLASASKDFVSEVYAREIPDESLRPMIEMIVSGYSEDCRQPEVWRISCYYDYSASKFVCDAKPEISRGQYNVIFGGQYDVIQRIVKGVDFPSYQSLRLRTQEVLRECMNDVEAELRSAGYTGNMPSLDFSAEKFDLFSKNWAGVTRLFSGIGNLSEQAGIDFVVFLISVMMKAQEFSTSIPTVGGSIHVALLTKNDGFRWISKEGFTFEGQHIPKYTNA
jgi:hypothetical protein